MTNNTNIILKKGHDNQTTTQQQMKNKNKNMNMDNIAEDDDDDVLLYRLIENFDEPEMSESSQTWIVFDIVNQRWSVHKDE